jgi:hypothetical protein
MTPPLRFLLAFLSLAALARGQTETALFRELVVSRRPASALALAQAGEPALPRLIDALKRRDRVAALAAWALWHHPHPGTAEALRAKLRQVDQVAAYFAARALGRLPSEENAAALAGLLAESPQGYWELSAGGKGRLRDAWNPAGERFAEGAPPEMPNLRVAYAAMESLGQIGGPTAAATLVRALASDQYLIRFGAARGLGRLPHPEAAPDLQRMAESDPVLIVRLAARQALGVIRATPGTPSPDILHSSALWNPSQPVAPRPALPPAIAFIKTNHRSDATLGFRDSYFFPKTPRYHSGENLYSLTPPRPDGVLKNLTQLSNGEVQGPEVSYDGTKILFAMRRDRDRDGFHIFEINTDGTGLRQITDGNCNDVDPCYLPDGRIAFCSDRAGWQEYYHQERSRVLHVMNDDGTGIEPITFNPNQDYEPLVLADGRISYSSYRFYAQDGSEGPLRGEWMGLARIETVLRHCHPDGSADHLLYGSMRGSFYTPMRPMPFSDQFAGWHPRGHHVGVSISQQREMPDGSLLCTSPAGLTVVDAARAPLDCEIPLYPEVVNLAGGEEVYIHNYDDMNPVGRYTSPHPAGEGWAWVSHAPWHDLRPNGYGLWLMNLATRDLEPVFDDPEMSEVDPVPLQPRPAPAARSSTRKDGRATGVVFCNSVFNSDLPFDRGAVRGVRVLEGVPMGQSIAANAAFRTRLLATTPIHPDGSFHLEVPADVPIRFELLDEDGRMIVHETEFTFVRPGEAKGCIGCHENPRAPSPNTRPLALDHPPVPALRHEGDLIYMGKTSRPYNRVYRQ